MFDQAPQRVSRRLPLPQKVGGQRYYNCFSLDIVPAERGPLSAVIRTLHTYKSAMAHPVERAEQERLTEVWSEIPELLSGKMYRRVVY